MSSQQAWKTLGITPTNDPKAIRQAYAAKLKLLDIDREAAAYAKLRNARDMAMRWARSQMAVDQGAAPLAEATLTEEQEWIAAEEGSAVLEEPQADDVQPNQPTADELLQHLLFPGNAVSDEGFSAEDYQLARACLEAIIEDAYSGDVARQRMVDAWLADRLARAWPRSAPLVGRAAEAFDWEKEAGSLAEGPAQIFLNARLRGMRFHEKVQEKGHWAYKTWKELAAPGKKSLFALTRTSTGEVRKLLNGIREHFPEVESYLDPGKVASWEGELRQEGSWSVGAVVLGLMILAQLMTMCARISSQGEQSSYANPYKIATNGGWSDADRNEIAQELFGPGIDLIEVRIKSPTVARFIEEGTRVGGPQEDLPRVEENALNFIRRLTQRAAFTADSATLIKIKQLKLDILDDVRRHSGDQGCVDYLKTGRVDSSLIFEPELRMKEREIAQDLLESGVLTKDAEDLGNRTARIPDEIFLAAERAAHLEHEAAQAAIKDTGSSHDRCALRVALLEQSLHRPGKAGSDLLRLL